MYTSYVCINNLIVCSTTLAIIGFWRWGSSQISRTFEMLSGTISSFSVIDELLISDGHYS